MHVYLLLQEGAASFVGEMPLKIIFSIALKHPVPKEGDNEVPTSADFAAD